MKAEPALKVIKSILLILSIVGLVVVYGYSIVYVIIARYRRLIQKFVLRRSRAWEKDKMENAKLNTGENITENTQPAEPEKAVENAKLAEPEEAVENENLRNPRNPLRLPKAIP